MQSDKHEPAYSPTTESTRSPQRNITTFAYGAALVVLFLGLPCLVVSLVVSDRSLANTMFGVGLTLIALGMAGLGLSSAALYRHPKWQLPTLFAFFPSGWLDPVWHAYTHGERTFPQAWFGCILAVVAAAAARVVFAYPLVAVPAAFWLGEIALFTIACVPFYMARLRVWWRTRQTRRTHTTR